MISKFLPVAVIVLLVVQGIGHAVDQAPVVLSSGPPAGHAGPPVAIIEAPIRSMGGPLLKRFEIEVVLAKVLGGDGEQPTLDKPALERLAVLGTKGYGITSVVSSGALLVYTLERPVSFFSTEWDRQQITAPTALQDGRVEGRLMDELREAVGLATHNMGGLSDGSFPRAAPPGR